MMLNKLVPASKRWSLRFKYISYFLTGTMLIMSGIWFFHWNDSLISYKFYMRLGEANETVFDLRDFNELDWDELDIVKPYGNICSLGIKDYEPGSSKCFSSTDDGEAYLLFLKDNELVHKINLNRGRLDLTNDKIQWRIKKENAVFVWVKNENQYTVEVVQGANK